MIKTDNKYYKILGVNRNSTENEIKIAYKLLAKKYHPDLSKEIGAKEKFIEIHDAYVKLLNPEVEYSLLNSLFGNLFMDKESGISFYDWNKLVKYEDFNISRQVAFLGRYIEFDKEIDKEEEENYKKYRWSCNKTKLLNKIFCDDLINFNSSWIKTYPNIVMNVATQGIKDIIIHLNRVLNKEVDIKEKIKKLINPIEKPAEGYYDHSFSKMETHQKLVYNTMNQFHPKNLNKLPNRVQIYVNKTIRYLIIRLEKELKELEVK